MTYLDELRTAMTSLADDPRAIFLGQAVAFPGTAMTETLSGVPREKLLELPVFENTQLGMSTGLALDGWLPVSIFPRWNFLICAADQLVNHLDKLPIYAGVTPRVIIRVASATPVPLDPGPQHLGDFSVAFRMMLKTVKIIQLDASWKILPAYKEAVTRDGSTILVEYPELYELGHRNLK